MCDGAPGRIRTSVAVRRLVYSQVQLSALPPTQTQETVDEQMVRADSNRHSRDQNPVSCH